MKKAIRSQSDRQNTNNLKRNILISTFVSDSGYRVVPTYQDKDGTSVFYAGSIIEKRQESRWSDLY